MPRLRCIEAATKESHRRRECRWVDAMEKNATELVFEHSSTIPLNCVSFFGATQCRACLYICDERNVAEVSIVATTTVYQYV
jgi:hypothetical protein